MAHGRLSSVHELFFESEPLDESRNNVLAAAHDNHTTAHSTTDARMGDKGRTPFPLRALCVNCVNRLDPQNRLLRCEQCACLLKVACNIVCFTVTITLPSLPCDRARELKTPDSEDAHSWALSL